MIPKPLTFAPKGNLRPTGIVLALLASLGAAYLYAQGDTPIVIGDGSLTMTSTGIPWSSFIGTGRTHNHPQQNKCVTSIDISMPALSHTITFDHEKVDVTVVYAGNFNIGASTQSNGTHLSITTDFTAFTATDANHLSHNNASGHITHLTISRNGTVVFDSNANGHSSITIHYQ
jgi:hypothetical protein